MMMMMMMMVTRLTTKMIMVMMDWSEICWSLSVLLEGVEDEISLFGLLTLDMPWDLLGSFGS
jgi:hypothetical protein